MLGLLLSLIIIALIASVAVWIINYIAPPEPIKKIIVVIIVVICLLYFISMIGGYVPPLLPHSRF